MENVNKAHNLAAIIRSCDAVGIHQMHAVSFRPYIRTRQNTAAGASKWVKVNLGDSVIPICDELRQQGMQILVATFRPDAVDFRSIDYTKPTAIIVGEELTGPSPDALRMADRYVYIPMFGIVESLNVSVAAAVILFEAQRQREAAGLYRSKHFSDEEYGRLLFEYTYPRLGAVLREQGKPYPELDQDGAFSTEGHLPS